jgi:hypothetical protein
MKLMQLELIKSELKRKRYELSKFLDILVLILHLEMISRDFPMISRFILYRFS